MAIKIYKKGENVQLSKNFHLWEFECPCGDCKETPVDEKLVEYLQAIRDHFGVPVDIAQCTYRCPAYNSRVPNAAPNSYHTRGMAADIAVEGVAPAEVAKFCESIGILGLGLYEGSDGNFVHIDTRTYKCFWYGHGDDYRTTFGGAPAEEDYTLERFVRDVQEATGAAVDGIPGQETLSKTVTISAKHNATHAAVKAVQKRLASLGYDEVGEADGIAGPMFTSALAHFQKDNECTPTGSAEEWGKTWHKLLGMA